MAIFIYPQQQVSIPGVATEATLLLVEQNTADTVTELQAVNTELQAINTELQTANTSLDSLETLVLTDAQLRATPVPVSGPLTDTQLRATPVDVLGPLTDAELRASAVPVSAASLPLPTGAATETTLSAVQTAVDALNARVAGSLVPEEFDEQVITYVLAGNGQGEIFQIVYKLATVTVKTVTLTYDGSDRLSGVVVS